VVPLFCSGAEGILHQSSVEVNEHGLPGRHVGHTPTGLPVTCPGALCGLPGRLMNLHRSMVGPFRAVRTHTWQGDLQGGS
jgi:hypothetical protein